MDKNSDLSWHSGHSIEKAFFISSLEGIFANVMAMNSRGLEYFLLGRVVFPSKCHCPRVQKLQAAVSMSRTLEVRLFFLGVWALYVADSPPRFG